MRHNESENGGEYSTHLEQLRLSSVEREFRRRVAEFQGIREEDEDGSVSTGIKKGLNLVFNNAWISLQDGEGHNSSSSRIQKLQEMEQKQRELDDAKRVLSEAVLLPLLMPEFFQGL